MATDQTKALIHFSDEDLDPVPMDVFSDSISIMKKSLLGYFAVITPKESEIGYILQSLITSGDRTYYNFVSVQTHAPRHYIFLDFLDSFAKLSQLGIAMKNLAENFERLFDRTFESLKNLSDGEVLSEDEYNEDFEFYQNMKTLYYKVINRVEG